MGAVLCRKVVCGVAIEFRPGGLEYNVKVA
jgi:hypothetical protein